VIVGQFVGFLDKLPLNKNGEFGKHNVFKILKIFLKIKLEE